MKDAFSGVSSYMQLIMTSSVVKEIKPGLLKSSGPCNKHISSRLEPACHRVPE